MKALFNIFKPKKDIAVQFINKLSGETIGIAKMPASKLPETFHLQTTVAIRDSEWLVEEAIPSHSSDFIRTGNLVLKVIPIKNVPVEDILFTMPTVSNEFPQTVESARRTDADVFITKDDYRQNEFLNVGSLALVEKEFEGIKNIRENHIVKAEQYTGFKNCHVRSIIGVPDLAIPFETLQSVLHTDSVGQVIIEGKVLKHGFACETVNTNYYGTLNGGLVTELCISKWNEQSESELLEISKAFNLIFVHWDLCEMIKP